MPEISNVMDGNDDRELIHAEFTGDNRALHRILAALMAQEIPVVSFAPRSGGVRLEEVFMSITEGENPA